jgi:NAD(P)-dependent dehydrogenase (short-subunit alcohol dehydrogenase family)
VQLLVSSSNNHEHDLASTDFAPGISQATAVSFAREGCTKIVLADRDERGLETTQRLINEVAGDGKAEILAVKTDVTSAEQIDHLIQTAVEQFGRIDYAINGAGEHSHPRVVGGETEQRLTFNRRAEQQQAIWRDNSRRIRPHQLHQLPRVLALIPGGHQANA